jgi:hypothetical protein
MARTLCTVCNGHGATECSICKSASYCPEKCKKRDERVHRILCREFVHFTSKPRPTEKAVLALYFPIRGTAPEFIWFENDRKVEKIDKEKPRYSNVFGDEKPDLSDFTIPVNYAKKFNLNNTLEMRMRAKFRFEFATLPLNMTIIETTRGIQGDRWAGPIVVYARSGTDNPGSPVDVTVEDLSSMVVFFNKYTPSETDGLGEALKYGAMVEVEHINHQLFFSMLRNHSRFHVNGVEITCRGDQHFLKVKEFLSFDVPDVHPIFHERAEGGPEEPQPTPVSKHMGLELLVRKVPPYAGWGRQVLKNYFGFPPYQNVNARYLNLKADPTSSDWGCTDEEIWGLSTGRVLVVRRDKLDITPHQVKALVHYCRYNISLAIEKQRRELRGKNGGVVAAERTKLIRDLMCRDRFEKFFEDFKDKKVKEGDASWTGEVSPYQNVAQGAGNRLAQGLSALALHSEAEDEE